MTLESNDMVRRLSTRLKMRHLVLLLQIQQHGSLTRVAEHMASSQPAVTNALAELESMFGTPLFERSPRGMLPTALGTVVLERAQAMLHDLDHLARDMEAVATGYAAHMHIGVVPFISGQMLSATLKRLKASMERRLTVTIHEGTSDQLLSQLVDHTVDLVIGRASAAIDLSQVGFEVLYRQQPRLIANRRLAARLARVKLDWNKLQALDWILGAPQTPMREQVSDLFLAAGTAPPIPIVESYSSKLIGELIASSENAVSIVPADIAEELVRIAGVAIVPYSFQWTLPPIAVFTRLQGRRSDVQTLFIDGLRTVCRETYAGRPGQE
jgi:DNA-binding transcriptional LysR family regulator